jgi:hypothetical protein
MKRVVRVFVCTACVVAFALSSSGCGMSEMGLAGEGTVHIDTAAPGKAYIAWSDAYEDEAGFVITGVVRRSDTVGPPVKVSVQASIISADGTVIDEAQSDDIQVPRRITSRVQGFKRFGIRLPSVPPEGSSVRVVARSN